MGGGLQVHQSSASALHQADFLPLDDFLSRMQSALADKVDLYPVRNMVRLERFLGMLPMAVH